MKIRVGIDRRRTVLERIRELGAPILVSANSLWDAKRNHFRRTSLYDGFDLALDSGGFVAMKRYGGYRWEAGQYCELAGRLRPSWWAQMDFCCEPQIAANRGQVFERIDRTAEHLHELEALAQESGTSAPMPVLQGWEPQDYCSGPIFDRPAEVWPSLVGIGSVCRRSVNGTHGLLSIVRALDSKCPAHVRFHLFGAKSNALGVLSQEFPERVESIDSMAWNVDCRWDAFHAGTARTADRDADLLSAWYGRQVARLETSPQLNLGL